MMFMCLFKRRNKKVYDFKKYLEENGQFGFAQKTKTIKTKYDEEVLLYHSKTFDNILKIKLYNNNRKGSIFINLLFEDNKMKIADINVLEGNISKGYGTILLDYALNLAKEKGVKLVTGSIFSDNQANYERQINFYRKYRFTINGDEIKLTLN